MRSLFNNLKSDLVAAFKFQVCFLLNWSCGACVLGFDKRKVWVVENRRGKKRRRIAEGESGNGGCWLVHLCLSTRY